MYNREAGRYMVYNDRRKIWEIEKKEGMLESIFHILLELMFFVTMFTILTVFHILEFIVVSINKFRKASSGHEEEDFQKISKNKTQENLPEQDIQNIPQ
jgi:nucleoside permease NupC